MKRFTKKPITAATEQKELSASFLKKLDRTLTDVTDIHNKLAWADDGAYITHEESQILEQAEDILAGIYEEYSR